MCSHVGLNLSKFLEHMFEPLEKMSWFACLFVWLVGWLDGCAVRVTPGLGKQALAAACNFSAV